MTGIVEGAFLRVVTVSVGCSLVLAPLLLLARRIQKRVAARTLYAVFLLVALRLAVPVGLELPEPVVTVPAPDYTLVLPAPPAPVQSRPAVVTQVPEGDRAVARPAQDAPAAPDEGARSAREVPVGAVLGLVWAAGALGCVVWAVASYAAAKRRLLRDSVPAGGAEAALAERLRAELGIRRPVRLCRSGRACSPLALGLLRPVVVLPEGARGEALELILRHELTHVRRWDVAYKVLLSLACAVHWFDPLVWLMDRAAGRCLELCCDDEVVRGLPEEARRRYGAVLLETAGNVRPLIFSTCFAGGKEQMKERLANLFARKRNSAALVCVVLAAVLLAGGLVACERAGGKEMGASPLEAGDEDRRALFRRYFKENYEEDTAGVVLADVTGDGQDEMLVLTMYGTGGEALSLREPVEAERFGWGRWAICGVREGEVVMLDALRDIGGAHVGWGQQYLVPQETGFAVLEYDPYEGQGLANHSYRLSCLTEEGEWTRLDSGEVSFSLVEDGSLITQGMEFSTEEEIDSFRSRVRNYGNSGVSLLIYNGDVRMLDYLNMAPADAFAGKSETVSALRERVSASGSEIAVSLENQARRELFQAYFDQNYIEDNASVVLADLTGDGLEEMLVITMDPFGEEPFPLRKGMTADQLTLGTVDYCTVRNDEVVVLIRRGTDVSSSHAGWGYAYLIPNPAGEGYAVLDFRPATGMGMAGYSYSVYTLGAEGFVAVEQEEQHFLLEREMLMGDASEDATPQEVQHFLDRAEAYRNSGVPLLVYQESFSVHEQEFAYLDAAPAEVFSGAITMDISSLRRHVVSEGRPLTFMLPEPWPDTPKEALDRLEAGLTSASFYPDGFVFRLPNYEGTWDVQLSGWARTGDNGEPVPVRYLEDEEWVSGRLYDVNTEAPWFAAPTLSLTPGTGDLVKAWVMTDEGCEEQTMRLPDVKIRVNPREIWFDELTLWAQAAAPDGTSEGRTIDLLELMEEYAWKSLVDVNFAPGN